MEISEKLLCLFSAQIEEQNGSYVVEIPKQELRAGSIHGGETYRVAVLSSELGGESEEIETETEKRATKPPVEEGERRVVEIEDIGEQGDGIARVERGYVVIVPDTERGDRVTVKITDVRQNVAFAEVVNQ